MSPQNGLKLGEGFIINCPDDMNSWMIHVIFMDEMLGLISRNSFGVVKKMFVDFFGGRRITKHYHKG